MEEESIQAYLNLIQQLFTCPAGEEEALLQANPELANEELLQVMLALAHQMQAEGEERGSAWLMRQAEAIAQQLGYAGVAVEGGMEGGVQEQEYVELLQLLMQAEVESGGEAVWALLDEHRSLLDLNFAEVIHQVGSQMISEHPETMEPTFRTTKSSPV